MVLCLARLVLVIVLALVAGALLTVAVAWGCAMWSSSNGKRYDSTPLTDGERTWLASYQSDLDGHEIEVRRMTTMGRHEASFQVAELVGAVEIPALKRRRTTMTCWIEQCGWPLLCLQSQSSGGVHEYAWNRRPIIKTKLHYDRWRNVIYIDHPWLKRPRWLPAQPIAVACAINTMFYAVMCCGLFAVPKMIRSRWRVRRGRCPTCGYPTGTSAVCTECGGEIDKR